MFNSFKWLCILLTIITLKCFWASGTDDSNKPVTEICLECLCKSMSDCNATEICVNGACGIFRITWTYWAEAGSLTLANDATQTFEAFTNCVNDPYCAANTIQEYMHRNGDDCNNDEKIDCLDFASIHKLGKLACRGDLPYTFAKTFYECLKKKEKII